MILCEIFSQTITLHNLWTNKDFHLTLDLDLHCNSKILFLVGVMFRGIHLLTTGFYNPPFIINRFDHRYWEMSAGNWAVVVTPSIIAIYFKVPLLSPLHKVVLILIEPIPFSS